MQPVSGQSPESEQPIDAILVAEPAKSFAPPAYLHFQRPEPAQFVVPKRFGMSAIFGIMTGLAILFAIFRAYNASPVLYLFFGVQSLVICLAQMFNGHTPRAASVVAGGLLLPLFLVIGAVLFARDPLGVSFCSIIGGVPLGAFLGYLTGTLAAGVFLIMDRIERLFLSAHDAAGRPAKSRSSAM